MTLPVVLTAGTSAYNIQRSLRFRSSASAYLSRTPASAGNQKTWTWSAWVKPARFASQQPLFNSYSSATNYGLISFSANAFYNANDTLKFNVVVSNSNQLLFETSAVYRDPSAWYHIVIALDTTQATNTNRVKMYVNGVQITAFITATYPTQNLDVGFFNTTNQHQIGSLATGTYGYFDGYMTEINFIDGQALTPSSFGQTNSATGVWQPAKYTGTYGTNGFYLPFTDTTSTTTISEDFSGNNNDWTSNNISLTSGATYDSMTDVPTNTNSNTANYCVVNPLIAYSNKITPTNGNITVTLGTGSNAYFGARSTFGVTAGKWYWECTVTAKDAAAGQWLGIGIILDNVNWPAGNAIGANSGGYEYLNDGIKYGNGSTAAYGASYTTGDVIGVALDADSQTLAFYKNGVSQGTAYTSIGSGAPWIPAFEIYRSTGTTQTLDANFGQRPFAYTPPTGFVALNTFNLPTPTIGATSSSLANKYFDINLSAATGATRTVTGFNFQPDMVWSKNRTYSTNGRWGQIDSVRGVNKTLSSNLTDAEVTSQSDLLTAFNSDGFTLGADANGYGWNYNQGGNSQYAYWAWRANGSGSTNTAGSITSTVSANTTAGFSIVTYTGTGANATVGHGLGVAPKMVIVKRRNAISDWCVYSESIGAGNRLLLSQTNASAADSTMWNSTAPTSSVFSIGTNVGVNSANTFVAYCFAEIAGYSKFGSYTGNGSSDGPFVFTGFRPKFVLIKSSSNSATNWTIFDTSRNPSNVTNLRLFPNDSSSELTEAIIDLLSNGFKLRTGTNTDYNANSATYIYMAFAENPFKYSLAR